MKKYRLSPNVRWVVERFTVIVTDGSGRVRALRYPEAAIWDLVSRGYAYDKVVPMMAHIAARDAAEADTLVRTTLENWAGDGLIEGA
jgi:hypothetical protein